MKIPSLGTLEGAAFLGCGLFVAYAVYKSYKAGQGMVESVKETVMGVVHTGDMAIQKARTTVTGGNFGTDDNQSAAETARLNRLENEAADIYSTPEDITPWNAMGDFNIGMYDSAESMPQFYSPSAVGQA